MIRMKAGPALALIFAALLLGTAPPAYAALFALAHEQGAITAEAFSLLDSMLRVLMIPGRLVLAPTPLAGALGSTDGHFVRDLVAFVVANSVGWSACLAVAGWAIRSVAQSRGRPGRSGQ
jgi:hypothetical protein